jgi:hypothetical protein
MTREVEVVLGNMLRWRARAPPVVVASSPLLRRLRRLPCLSYLWRLRQLPCLCPPSSLHGLRHPPLHSGDLAYSGGLEGKA